MDPRTTTLTPQTLNIKVKDEKKNFEEKIKILKAEHEQKKATLDIYLKDLNNAKSNLTSIQRNYDLLQGKTGFEIKDEKISTFQKSKTDSQRKKIFDDNVFVGLGFDIGVSLLEGQKKQDAIQKQWSELNRKKDYHLDLYRDEKPKLEEKIKSLQEKFNVLNPEVKMLAAELSFVDVLDEKVSESERKQVELQWKLGFPYLHQCNFLSTKLKLPANFEEAAELFTVNLPVSKKNIGDLKLDDFLNAIKLLIEQNKKGNFFTTNTLFFSSIDPRVEALEKLLDNPNFNKQNPEDQLNLIRNEIASVHNANSFYVASLLKREGYGSKWSMGEELKNMFSSSTKQAVLFFTGIAELDLTKLYEVYPDVKRDAAGLQKK